MSMLRLFKISYIWYKIQQNMILLHFYGLNYFAPNFMFYKPTSDMTCYLVLLGHYMDMIIQCSKDHSTAKDINRRQH